MRQREMLVQRSTNLIRDGLAQGKPLRVLVRQVCKMLLDTKPVIRKTLYDERKTVVLSIAAAWQKEEDVFKAVQSSPEMVRLCKLANRPVSDFASARVIRRIVRAKHPGRWGVATCPAPRWMGDRGP